MENKELWVKLDTLNVVVKPEWNFVPREMNAIAEKLAKEGANKVVAESGSSSTNPRVGTGCVICDCVESKEMLTCSTCSRKVHYACTALPNYQLAVLRKTSRKYTCECCVVNSGDIDATEARKSFGNLQNIVPINATGSGYDRGNVESADRSDDIKCIQEDVKSLKGSMSSLEREILRVVSQLCDENLQLRENACEARIKSCEKEKENINRQLQKYENVEAELRSQIKNQGEKNGKLNVECERLRENMRRRDDEISESKQALKEKCEIISTLKTDLESVRTENEKLKSDLVADQSNRAESNPMVESIHPDVPLQNRFVREPPSTRAEPNTNRNKNPDAVYFKGHREQLSNFYRMNFFWNGTKSSMKRRSDTVRKQRQKKYCGQNTRELRKRWAVGSLSILSGIKRRKVSWPTCCEKKQGKIAISETSL